MCGTDMNELTEFVMTEFMNERIWMKSYKKDKKIYVGLYFIYKLKAHLPTAKNILNQSIVMNFVGSTFRGSLFKVLPTNFLFVTQ